MPNSTTEKLALVKELLNEGQIEKALQHVKDIEQRKNLTIEETLTSQRYKFELYSRLGKLEILPKIAEELYQKSQKMNKTLFVLDALAYKWMDLELIQVNREEANNILEQYDKLFKSIPRENSSEFQEREIMFSIIKGKKNFRTGNLDLSLVYYNKALTLIEQLDPQSYLLSTILFGIAVDHYSKGEFKIAMEYIEKSLSNAPKGDYYGPLQDKADIYRAIGQISYEIRDFEKALEYHTRGLEIYKKIGAHVQFAWASFHTISVLLVLNNIEQAQYYLHQFKEYNERYANKFRGYSIYIRVLYQLSQASILKASSRIRDNIEAESILKKIIEEDHHYITTNIALVCLCEWYFEEFQISNQMDVLDDLFPLIDHLQRNASQQNSYFLLAHVKLFKAKLALLHVNMYEARKLLTEAQNIADEHGLQLLAGDISKEHDRLLVELKVWESIKKTQIPVLERLKLASVDEVLERMQRKRAIELPEFDKEVPILLLIMDKSGVTYFNYSFVEDWDFSDLFSSFMSAFNDFSTEIFSKSIDRIKVGENTILINPVKPFLACYIIKGQSYPAQQKLSRFSAMIKATTEIWDALTKAVSTGETLQLDDPPSLGNYVNEIFIR